MDYGLQAYRPGQALLLAFGLAYNFSRPELPQARPKPGLSGQAGAGPSLTKADQLIISGTRFFGKNLTTDLKPDGKKELKKVGYMLFPCFFGHAKILSKIFGIYHVLDLGI